ncbi:LysR family transcriptional regulator, partial [Sutterella parvirubra]
MKTALDDPSEHLTLQQLRFLQDLARTQKLTKTASNFGMSLASASRTLEKLRAAFGDQLLTPQARGLSPTKGLYRVLPDLETTIDQAAKLFQPFVFDPKALEGRFHLVSRGLAVPEILAYVVPRLAKEAPGLVLEHRPRTSAVWEDIEDGRADLAIVTDRNVPP